MGTYGIALVDRSALDILSEYSLYGVFVNRLCI